MKKPLLLLPVAVLIAACSSSPKPTDAVSAVKSEAARLTGLAAKTVRAGGDAEAQRYYAEAFRLATSIADDDARIAALDGLAELYAKTGDVLPAEPVSAGKSASAQNAPAASASAVGGAASTSPPATWGYPPQTGAECVALARIIASESGRADLAAFASISEAEAVLRAGTEADAKRAADMMAAAGSALGSRPSDKSRALRVLASARKILGDSKGALDALADAASIDLSQKKYADYAADRYLAASVHSKLAAYPAAIAALQDALGADRKAENPSGIGADYRALGLVAEKSGDKAAARRWYLKARDVFAAARLSAEAADAEKRRVALE